LVVKSYRLFNEKYLYPDFELSYEHKYAFDKKPEKLDGKDLKILTRMADNSRTSIVEIARDIDLTPEATAKRLRSLLKRELIIGFKPRISFTKLGYDYFHVFVSAKTPEDTKNIIDYYKNHPDCIAILEEIGYFFHLIIS
jgi:DNA-binding Lrp family transcriptional regulator